MFARNRIRLAALLLPVLMSLSPLHADTIVGTADPLLGSSVAPFGDDNVIGYQQIYSSSDFTGPLVDISALTFYVDQTQPLPDTVDPATYSVYLSTTTGDLMSLGAPDPNNPVGTLFYQGAPTVAGNTLTLQLSTDFQYNLADGNLLVDIEKDNFTPGQNSSTFTLALLSNQDSGLFSSSISDGGGCALSLGGCIYDGQHVDPVYYSPLPQLGLVTDFVTVPANSPSVPEAPASPWYLAGVTLSALLWRKHLVRVR